jgi:hypothetical protein
VRLEEGDVDVLGGVVGAGLEFGDGPQVGEDGLDSRCARKLGGGVVWAGCMSAAVVFRPVASVGALASSMSTRRGLFCCFVTFVAKRVWWF